MSKNSSAKYYQDNKERLQKKLLKDINLLKKKKERSNNMVVKDTKVSQNEKQKLVEYGKSNYKMRKSAML